VNEKLLTTMLALTLAGVPQVHAQPFPSKPVRYIVPFPAGGAPDIVGRLVSDRLTKIWGQQVLVDNRSGAGGSIGGTAGARATPDGYTLFQCNIASNAIAVTQYAKLPYDVLRDFAPISRIGLTPNALVVHPSTPFRTIRDYIQYAKANPGKLIYGSSGLGASPHLSMELFNMLAGVKVTHVSYKGGAPALTDLIAGQIPSAVTNIPAILPLVQSGRARALAVTSAARLKLMPSTPTMIESGLPDFEVNSWYGVCAPAGTPAPVVARLNADVTKVLHMPDVRQRLEEMVVDVAPTTPEEFAVFIAAETRRWTQVAKRAGIVPQ
jgi:tripartite-type tricarboxylate transporter receptor subunit TctC